MHQSHNIPWHTFSDHYKPTRNHHYHIPNSDPNLINILPLETPQISPDVNHFIRKFSDTVRLFASTERAKYPDRTELVKLRSLSLSSSEPNEAAGKLFTDELRERYPGILNEENQKIEGWIVGNDFHYPGAYDHDPHVKSRKELICFFIHENHLLPLLILANHPQFSMSSLIERNLDQWKEFSHVKSAALRAYVFFNAADALGMFASGDYAKCQEYRNIIKNIARERDYEGQDTIHVHFLRKCGILQGEGEVAANEDRINWDHAFRLHEQERYEILKQYLKDAFALIYRYEVFFREENGDDPNLEWELSYCSPISTPTGVHNPVTSSFPYTTVHGN